VTTSTTRSVSPDSGAHWAEPGAWPAAPGVLRIPLPLPHDGLRAVNVYVLSGADGLTLIDGGWALESSRALLDHSLAGAGLAVSDIRRFLVTHAHRDHYTQAVTVRREVGSEVWIGLEEQPSFDAMHTPVEDPDDFPHLRLLRSAGAPELARVWGSWRASAPDDLSQWETPDRWIEDEQTFDVGDRSLTAVSTPGHTRGHYVFADTAHRTLFSGDHVLPTITPSIGFEREPVALPLRDFLASLRRVRDLPDCQLLPAHGPVTGSSHRRVDELLVHHDQRLVLCRDAVGAGGSTAYDVATELTWTRHERPLGELDPFNSGLAVLETRTHLELLVDRGELSSSLSEEGATVYAAGPR
jgi:glyoxylase-like metal-dependent hydrolase (beta-lactamase superfamily II)